MADFSDKKIVQSFFDIKNFFRFRKDIKMELAEPKSGMNNLGIKRNWLGNILYMQINCTDTDLMNAGYDFDRMVMIKLKPAVQYLGQDLGWSEYLVPKVNNFVDEEGNPTLSYGILFIYTGYRMTLTKALLWMLGVLGVIGIGIWALCRYL
jgi:hypothetical protein